MIKSGKGISLLTLSFALLSSSVANADLVPISADQAAQMAAQMIARLVTPSTVQGHTESGEPIPCNLSKQTSSSGMVLTLSDIYPQGPANTISFTFFGFNFSTEVSHEGYSPRRIILGKDAQGNTEELSLMLNSAQNQVISVTIDKRQPALWGRQIQECLFFTRP